MKYTAAFAMLLDHIAVIFLPGGSLAYALLRMLGGMTAITMCFFLAEGYRKTADLKKYKVRLMLFAVCSQLPYMLAFQNVKDKGGAAPLNMLFNLFFCLCMLEMDDSYSMRRQSRILFWVFAAASCFCDWSLLAPCYVLLFDRFRRKSGQQNDVCEGERLYGNVAWKGWAAAVALSLAAGFAEVLQGEPIRRSFLHVAGQILAMALILCGYHGRTALKHKRFHKWFFYFWYPVHLTILAIVYGFIPGLPS